MGKPLSVTGAVHFPQGSIVEHAAKMYVRLLNVSYADAPSKTEAEQIIEVPPGSPDWLRFVINLEAVEPATHYAVSVHVDIDGDGKISRGDYITTQRYSVLTFGRSNHVAVDVQRVD